MRYSQRRWRWQFRPAERIGSRRESAEAQLFSLSPSNMPSPTEPLKLNEVGAYGDLIGRPNPDGFVVLSLPPFETLLPFIVRQRGRELTPDEIEAERKRVPSIALTKDAAEQLAAERAKAV